MKLLWLVAQQQLLPVTKERKLVRELGEAFYPRFPGIGSPRSPLNPSPNLPLPQNAFAAEAFFSAFTCTGEIGMGGAVLLKM